MLSYQSPDELVYLYLAELFVFVSGAGLRRIAVRPRWVPDLRCDCRLRSVENYHWNLAEKRTVSDVGQRLARTMFSGV